MNDFINITWTLVFQTPDNLFSYCSLKMNYLVVEEVAAIFNCFAAFSTSGRSVVAIIISRQITIYGQIMEIKINKG